MSSSRGSRRAGAGTGLAAIVVAEEPGAGYGSTDRDLSGAPVFVANAVPDPDGFYNHFLSTLSGVEVEARVPVALDETTVPASVDADSSLEEVLAFWLVHALKGDVETAASVVAPGAPWVAAFSPSADAFVEGLAPFASHDVELECTSAGDSALCTATWNDLWIAEIPELDRGELRAHVEVVDGTITAFHELVTGAAVLAAVSDQAAWLQSQHPDRVGEACVEVGSAECDQLFLDTVSDWVAGR